MKKCLDYQGIARRDPNSLIIYDKKIDMSAMLIQSGKRKFKVIDRAIQKEKSDILETLCEQRDHKPSNINPIECDCGSRRFDD